jgi:predicted DNA-binding protein
MKRPNFFIVGAPRCGTTAMYQYLKKHPEIFMPDEWKEPYFFGSDLSFRKPRMTREQYLSLFSRVRDEKRIGEASVLYLYSKHAAKEIKEFCPESSIIIMLRNPVDMIYSWHSELLYEGSENIEDFASALDAMEDRKRGLRIPTKTNLIDCLYYLDIPRYTEQVQRYLDNFGRENVHIIIFDDFQRDTAGVYKETLDFLRVNPHFSTDLKAVNPNKALRVKALRRLVKSRRAPLWLRVTVPRPVRSWLLRSLSRLNTRYSPRPPIAPELRMRLQVEFTPEIERLSELLGRDLTHWVRDAIPTQAGSF